MKFTSRWRQAHERDQPSGFPSSAFHNSGIAGAAGPARRRPLPRTHSSLAAIGRMSQRGSRAFVRDSIDLLPGTRRGELPQLHVSPDGVLTLQNGEQRAVLEVELVNLDCCTPPEKDALSAGLATAFGTLLPGQLCQVLVQSRPTDAATMLPSILAHYHPEGRVLEDYTASLAARFASDIERVQAANRSAYIIVAPAPLEHALGDPRQTLDQQGERRRRALDMAVDQLRRQLEGLQITVRRLPRPDVIRVLWHALHPLVSAFPPDEHLLAVDDALLWPPAGGGQSPRDPLPPAAVAGYWLQRSLTGITLHETARHVRLEYADGTAVYARTLPLLEPPEFTSPGWLDPVLGLPFAHTITIYAEGRDRKAERGRLNRQRRALNILNLDATRRGGITNLDADSAQAEATRTALETQDPAKRVLRWGVYLTIFAPSEAQLNVFVERAASVLRTQMLAEAGRGIGHQLPFLQASLPLAVDTADRRFRVRSETVGNAFPFLTHNPGMSRGIPLGFSASHNELVLLDLDHPGLGNLVMTGIGMTGSGKTQFAQNFALQVVNMGGRVIVVDKAGHYQRLLGLLEGTAVTFGGETQPAINIWDGPITAHRINFLVNAHEILLCKPGEELDPLRKALLSEGIRAVYAWHAAPLERDLVAWLWSRSQAGEDNIDLYKELFYTLSPYVGDGEHAGLLDRPTNVDLENRFVVFDLDALPPKLQPFVMYVIADRVRGRVVGRRRARGELITDFFVVDEGWAFLLHQAIAAWLSEVARKSRHWGLAVLFLTQQVSDLTNNPAAKALFNAASLHFLFRQSDATGEGINPVAWLRDTLSLSQAETERLYGLATVPREYAECLMIFKSKTSAKQQRGVIQLRYHPWAYWATTSHPHADVPYLTDMIEALGGDVWAAVKACAAGDEVPDLPLDEEPRVLTFPTADLPATPAAANAAVDRASTPLARTMTGGLGTARRALDSAATAGDRAGSDLGARDTGEPVARELVSEGGHR